MKNYLFFDNASTTKCCDEAVQLVCKYANEDFGNPSSSHVFGQQAARAIREARQFFADLFHVSPEQVIFTGSGSEADNLAVYGVTMEALSKRMTRPHAGAAPMRVICSAIEHPAVRKTVQTLASYGIDTQIAPVDAQAQLKMDEFVALLTPETVLVSVQQVNNIVGSVLPVEKLAQIVKERAPNAVFHTDAIQAFGRVALPFAPSPVDLISISGHKIEGPKGIGALIVMDKALLKNGLRPIIHGGGQENGWRSGTQSAGLIAGFHAAAKRTAEKFVASHAHVTELRALFRRRLQELNLLTGEKGSPIHWNSPAAAVPHIVSLSVPGYPAAPLAKLLEERGCLVSTGSACSAQKVEPDPVLSCMGLPAAINSSAIRVSFSATNSLADVETLVAAFDESMQLMQKLLGGSAPRKSSSGAAR